MIVHMASIPVDYVVPILVSLVPPIALNHKWLLNQGACELTSQLFVLQVCAANIVSQDGEQNGHMGRVDEGVDEFFTKKVTKMDSKWVQSNFTNNAV